MWGGDDKLPQGKNRSSDLFFHRQLCKAQRQSSAGGSCRFTAAGFPKNKKDHPFQIDAIVVLPDHLHCIWTLPHGDANYKTRWALIKASFSRQIPGGETRSASRVKRGERGLWQRRYWEHLIRDDLDYQRHVDYIHWNPVKHGLVRQVDQWPHSSFHAHVKQGICPAIWAGEPADMVDVGEMG